MQNQHQTKEERERRRKKRADRRRAKETKKAQNIIRREDVEQLTFWDTLVNDFKDAPFTNSFITLCTLYVTVISLVNFDISLILWIFSASAILAFLIGLFIPLRLKDRGRLIDAFILTFAPVIIVLIPLPILGFIGVSYLATGVQFDINQTVDISILHIVGLVAGIDVCFGYIGLGRLIAVWRENTGRKSRKEKAEHE